MPRINNVALGKQKELLIYGNDYSTKDGTGVRDYIHIVDLARGHLMALDYLKGKESFYDVFNLGRGKGTTVLELIEAFEEISGLCITRKFTKRRAGDIAESWASVSKIRNAFCWEARHDLKKICEDNWKWLKNNHEIPS